MKAVLERQAPELFGASRRVRGDEDLFARRERPRQVGRGLGRAAAVAGDRLGRKPEDRGAAPGDSEAIETERDRGQPPADRLLRVQELLGSEGVAVRVPVGGRALREAFDLLADGRGLEDDHEPRGRVIEPGGRHLRDGRREHRALRLRRRAADPLGQKRPGLLGFLGGGEGRDPDLLEPLGRTLRVGIEEAQRLDPVSVELDADGELAVRRKDVEEPAANGQVAGLDHEVRTVVAQTRQPLGQARERDLFAASKPHEELAEARGVGEADEQGPGRQHRRVPGAGVAQGGQQGELVAPRLQRRRDALVRGQRRGRSVKDAREAGGREILDERLRLLLARDDDRERSSQVARERREQNGREGAHAAGDDQTVFSPANSREEVRVGRQVAGEINEQHWKIRRPSVLPDQLATLSRFDQG